MWWMLGPHLEKRADDSAAGRGHVQVSPRPNSAKEATGSSLASQRRRQEKTPGLCREQAEDVQEFVKLLCHRFGSVSLAWRFALDVESQARLDFRSFSVAVHKLGCKRNLRTLWYNLDQGNTGFVTLYDLDPEAAQAFDRFRYLCTSQLSSISHAWRVLIGEDLTVPIPLARFAQGVEKLGYSPNESAELFEYFLRPGDQRLLLRDVEFLQSWEDNKQNLKEKLRARVGWVNKDPYRHVGKDSGRPKVGNDNDQKPTSYAMKVATDGECRWQNFKNFLMERFNSLAVAFDALDASGSGSLSLLQFQKVVCGTLEYCRASEAKRLFMLAKGNPSPISWRDFGVSPQEWIEFLTEKKWQEQLNRNFDAAMITSKPSDNPRARVALADHMKRVKHEVPPLQVAFGSLLPSPSQRSTPRPPSSASIYGEDTPLPSMEALSGRPQTCSPRPPSTRPMSARARPSSSRAFTASALIESR